METGIVTESTGSRYIILTPDGRRLETRLRGRLRLNGSRTTNPVAVGDRVLYEETPEGATITEGGEGGAGEGGWNPAATT